MNQVFLYNLKRLFPFFLLIIFMCCIPSISFCEGTKQILLNDSGHGKIQIMPGFNQFAWYASSGNSAPEEYRLYIHISNVGEKIYFGFGDPLNNSNAIVNDVHYRIKDPSGNIVAGPSLIPLSGNGHISTFNQAVAGPAGIVPATGYPFLMYLPTTTGDYYIEFNFATGFGGNDRCKFKYFDITVGSTTNQAVDGRVWSKAWQMTADNQAPPSGQYTFWGKLFVFSDDGIVTSINFNGMEPYVFTVSCNPWGCYNTGNFITDRRSVSGNHTLTQYKIFLNNPDPVAYPTGILGSIIPPVTFQPDCDGTGTIMINVTKAGNVDILLDLNPAAGVQPEDVQLSQSVTVGNNYITWNGIDGMGNPVTNGTTFMIEVTYINGLTNLPIYDVEQNPSGFIVELHRPSGPAPAVFWDDILVGGTQNFDGCNFIPPSTGCHIFSGDSKTMNTWWYAVSSTLAPVTVTLQRTPYPPGAITGPASVCPGATGQIYWINWEENSTTFAWGYTGMGATITALSDTMVLINFANNATSGNLIVNGINPQCGAGDGQIKAITIYPAPVVALDTFTPVCIDEPPFLLSGGTPTGGTYQIAGIPATVFNPANYGLGSHEVTYIYTDPGTSCTASDEKPLLVLALPTVTLPPFDAVCIDTPVFSLAGGLPAGGTYSGTGVTGGTFFDPIIAGTGTHEITYAYADANSCTNVASNFITVNTLPTVSLIPFAPVCVNAPAFTVTGGIPSGGIFTGTGVSSGVFNPAIAGAGTHSLVYTFTDANGCTNSATHPIIVNPLPGVPETISGPNEVCQGETGSLFSASPVADAISYGWVLTPSSAGVVTGSTTNAIINWNIAFTGTTQLVIYGINTCGEGPASPPLNILVKPGPDVTFSVCTDTVTTTNAKPFLLKGGIPYGGIYSGSGISAGIFHPSLAGSGTHKILYTYSNIEGCGNLDSITIRVISTGAWNCGDTLTDPRDHKVYPTVLIGTQCWIAANLNYGLSVSSINPQRDNCIIEKYCFQDNIENCNSYGGLYQWDELMAYYETEAMQGLCPPGWHIPDETEWNQLFTEFTTNGFAGSPLKYTGYSGFNAYMTGFNFFNLTWKYGNTDPLLHSTLFWSSTIRSVWKAWAHGMNEVVINNDFSPSVSSYPSLKNNAFSVRCIKD